MQVVKRDGSLQEFDSNKIVEAISKAFNACCPDENRDVINAMVSDMHLWDGITIEEIQDVVIETLRDYGYDDVASAYSQYRSEQSRLREIIAKISYQDNYINSSENAATSSETDGNANVVSKNVATLESEDRKRENREIQRYRMKKKLKLLYPELSSQYARDLDSHIIYTHDEASTSVLKQYCMAVSLYPLMLEGVGNIDGVTPGPPNDLQSFSGQVTNLVFLLSSQCKGAVAVGSYFIALNYYIIAEYGENGMKSLAVYVPPSIHSLSVLLKTVFSKHSNNLFGELISLLEIEAISRPLLMYHIMIRHTSSPCLESFIIQMERNRSGVRLIHCKDYLCLGSTSCV